MSERIARDGLAAPKYEQLRNWASSVGILVVNRPLDADGAGEFDGISATMNDLYPVGERLFYLAHALGSMVLWSTDEPSVQAMFDELRDAQEHKRQDGARFEAALKRYRQFEIDSSALVVRLLEELGGGELIRSYSNFMWPTWKP